MRTQPAIILTNILLASLILLIGSVAIYFQYFYRPHVDPAYVSAILDSSLRRIEANAKPIEREARDLSEQTMPIVQAALIERARSDYPLYAQALEQQGSQFLNNVERAFVDKVKLRYHDYLRRHRRILRSEFPEHATRQNVERILAAFERTLDELVERYYLDQFRREAARTESLWRAIPPARQAEPGEPALEEQLADATRAWMLTALQRNDE